MDISINRDKDIVSVKLAGVINEDNDLAEHLDQITGSLVAIDLSEVERINSCGVRDWVNWIHALEARGSRMVFLDCSPSIVAQINLVNNFTGSGHIKSFYLPYYCESCNEEHAVLYEAQDLASEQLPPASRCSGCEQFMDFDDMPDAYFAFLSDEDLPLRNDTLLQAENLALSKKSVRSTTPVLALGSSHLPDIDQLLETTTRTEEKSVAAALAPAPEAARVQPVVEKASGRERAFYAGIGLLIGAAAVATHFLL